MQQGRRWPRINSFPLRLGSAHIFHVHILMQVEDGDYSAYDHILNHREKRCLEGAEVEYRKRYRVSPNADQNLVVYLGDNFRNRKTWSGTSGRIPTFRTGGGLMWWFAAARPMTQRERLATLAFPVTASAATAMGVPELPVRDRKRAASIAGNSMNFATVAIVQLVALASFRKIN